ncbi:helix-turn-helix domain-containing protein [Streptomyces sp. NPDC026672]|uniref:TetR/AcrR family transcriptional regulator n=1 Tax=unclassified Streptomyces TaxID=2593676 RepID=UPI0033E629C8
MTPDHKTSSAGGTGQQARTRLARAAVVDAARALFVERGYAATTVEAISERSDVPPATVYRLFSSKIGILMALIDAAVTGTGGAAALADQPAAQALLAEPDPARQLAGFAAICRETNVRTAPLYRILASAAASDRDAAALLAERAERRSAGQRQIARALARAGTLRPGVRERDAADVIHALMSPEVFKLLVSDRGWPPQRYEQWLTQTLTDQLLPR